MNCWCNGKLYRCFHNEYFRCSSCGTFVSRNNTPQDFYDFKKFWYERQEEVNGHPNIEKRAKLDFFNRIPFWWERIKNLEIRSVLEIGCGHGGFLHYCKSNGVEECLGIEISEGTCDFARKEFGLDILCGTFPDVDIKREFDLVCGFDVIEHLIDPVLALNKMKLLGKYIMIQIPVYRGGNKTKSFISIAHQYIFTEESIRHLFSELGIKIISSCNGCFEEDMTLIGEVI
jgi:SAM-dependent methyltransferase